VSSRIRSSFIVLLIGVVAACSGGTSSPSASAPASVAPSSPSSVAPSVAPSASAEPVTLGVGLGFIPSVQFAPFYLADQAGYYKDAGLEVTFRHGTDYDVVALVGAGDLDIGISDGTSVIPAVSQGIPVKYIATIYGKFPSIVFAKASSGISGPADLAGKKLGIPGKYGSSWIMLQALLGSVSLTPDDLTVVEYPDYSQGGAVAQGAVDAATGFANNEPVQLELTGEKTVVLHVDDITPLPGPGLISSTATLEAKRDAVARFVDATLRAMNEITADPAKGLDAAIVAVPELASARDTQAAILDATIDTWMGTAQATGGLGALDVDGWTASIAYLTELKMVPNPVTVDDVLDPGLLNRGG
jgi:NitT/TauT family transport system substrate-binding protein